MVASRCDGFTGAPGIELNACAYGFVGGIRMVLRDVATSWKVSLLVVLSCSDGFTGGTWDRGQCSRGFVGGF